MLTLGKFVFLTVIVAHWMACAWHMIKIIEDDTANNWVIGYLGADHDHVHHWVWRCRREDNFGACRRHSRHVHRLLDLRVHCGCCDWHCRYNGGPQDRIPRVD